MVVSKKLDQYITNRYPRWLDHAEYHAAKAGIPDEAGDILNEVILDLLGKPESKIEEMLSRKKRSYNKKDKREYAELDWFILKMIRLNAYSKTSPYRHKTRSIPLDQNVNPYYINTEDLTHEEIDRNETILDKNNKVREILESLNIPEADKKIFSWKFFGDNSLRSWPGEESYSVVCGIYNRVKRQAVAKIKNPYTTRKSWSREEIAYLKAEYPNMETMTIAHFLERNYKSVCRKAECLGLKKTSFTKRKIQRRCGEKTFYKPAIRGDSP